MHSNSNNNSNSNSNSNSNHCDQRRHGAIHVAVRAGGWVTGQSQSRHVCACIICGYLCCWLGTLRCRCGGGLRMRNRNRNHNYNSCDKRRHGALDIVVRAGGCVMGVAIAVATSIVMLTVIAVLILSVIVVVIATAIAVAIATRVRFTCVCIIFGHLCCWLGALRCRCGGGPVHP